MIDSPSIADELASYWIDCNERMPNGSEDVIVWYEGDRPDMAEAYHTNGIWMGAGYILSRVTHWMPKPARPKMTQ
jgi:hypothetical protein